MKKRLLALLLITVLVFATVPTTAFAKDTEEENLIKNGSFENFKENDEGFKIPANWKDKDGIWGLDTHDDEQIELLGEYFYWPIQESCEQSMVYQDVDITDYPVGQWFNLEGYLCNYDQPPNDKSTIKLEFKDKKGAILASYTRSQRNPVWILQKISAQKPKNAVEIRVKLIATRFKGSDNDGYFDNIVLTAAGSNIEGVYITGDSGIKAGKSTTLTANNGKSTDPTLFDWTTSYDTWATVDKKGKVSLSDEYDPEEGVTIYATEKKTGNQAAFNFGKNVENEGPVAKVAGLKASSRKTTTITLKWAASAGASKYTVYKYNPDTKKYEKVKTTTKAKLTVSKLKKATEYKFKVVAEGTYGSETYTAAASDVLKVKTK